MRVAAARGQTHAEGALQGGHEGADGLARDDREATGGGAGFVPGGLCVC